MKAFFISFLSLPFAVVICDAKVIPKPAKAFPSQDASTLIVGGRKALQGEVPYQLDVRIFDSHFCGASLVEVEGLQIALSVGHCILSETEIEHTLVAGDINYDDRTGIEQTLNVTKIVIHQNYTGPYDLKNDIAVLFFNGSFTLNENVQTIPLPTQGQVTDQGNFTVSGWGQLTYNGTFPADLHIVKIPVVNDTYCQEAYKDYLHPVTDDMICTGVPTGGISPCHGDSGGPAISDAGYLAGIVSWGPECGHPDYPAVYTKVSHYIDWIHDTARDYKTSL